ncbi:MAG: LEA type 2 family protein [Pseudomonadota bacterium]
MKTLITHLLRPATLALLGLALTACATLQEVVKEPEVTVRAMRVAAVSLSDMQLDFTLGVDNPNPVGLSLKGLSYRLSVDDQSLLAGESKTQMKVAANGSSDVSLPLTLNYRELSGGLKEVMQRETIPYSLQGKLDFGLFRLPYSKSGTLTLPSLPRIRVEQVEVARLGLSGLDLVLALTLHNDNSFPLRLDGIDYGLSLADTTVARGQSLDALSLEPGSSGRFNVGLSLGYGELGSLLDTLRSRDTIPVRFEGQMQLPDAEPLPLNWEGSVGIQR